MAGLDSGRHAFGLTGMDRRATPVMPEPRQAPEDRPTEPGEPPTSHPTQGSETSAGPNDRADDAPDLDGEPPYPGAAHPLAGGASPSPDYRVKARITGKRYYAPDSMYFARTVAELWFRNEEEAQRAGFEPAG